MCFPSGTGRTQETLMATYTPIQLYQVPLAEFGSVKSLSLLFRQCPFELV